MQNQGGGGARLEKGKKRSRIFARAASYQGQMVDWVRIKTSGGQLLPMRGLKGHRGLESSCSSNLVSLGGRCHIAVM